MTKHKHHPQLIIGRNEWCQLPDMNIPAIKVKVDTGAKTSAIHAFNIHQIIKDGKTFAQFDVHPIQGNNGVIVSCIAPVLAQRNVMSSNGQKECRLVIETTLSMGAHSWNIELTLTNRDLLRYRMLLGREALNHNVLVDPSLSCNQGTLTQKALLALYNSQ